ncbi:hypothetical protein QBC38DRAFT_411872 [Podospora fimiseda]|uniref:Uncharacterized protein n=1 Tax=Podospora fimiseda TaxID=252190 RepID=A0AAN7H5F7_9PEZI|nr:hypothetical protein QBC38DRAFT_411872 [Podospora fimiseda]
MGGKSNKPPLPVPTETNSTIHTAAPTGTDLGTELGTDVSAPGDERSSYSIPEDGTPVTIKGHRASKSQTSLLIEYFEGGKGSSVSGSVDQRKPSVRVRLTPSSGRRKHSSGSDRDRIKITHQKTRKTSGSSHRSIPAGTGSRAEGSESVSALGNDYEDASSYASATEESNVSRNPIDIEIERGGSSSRRRRPASPLIPAADSKAGYVPPPSSDISAIPTDSFLDGSGGYTTTSFRMSDLKSSKGSRDRSPPRAADYLASAAIGAGAATAIEKLRNREGRERAVISRSRDKEKDKEREKDRERRHKSSKSRTSSVSRDDNRRRSTKGHTESLASMADSSIVSSALAPSHRSDVQSVKSVASKASSINNPKLLETVEDAIRRLILPELNALKREQSKRGSRRDSATSSTTTLFRDDFASDRRRSGTTDKALTPRDSVKISKERRDREARNDFDDSSALSRESIDDSRDLDDTPVCSADHIKAAAAGAALGAAAVAAHEAFNSPSDDKQRSRRRRRAEQRSRDQGIDGDSDLLAPPGPLMPLMSDVNASDVTRASILSADTDRPHSARSASEEFNGIRDFSGSSQLSAASSSAPSGIPPLTLQALGTQHANVSHGDLKTLPNQRTGDLDEYVLDDSGKKVPSRHHRGHEEDDDFDDEDLPSMHDFNSYYSTQDVPPPLKYVPYQPERRGLSPIPSVSGYTDTASEHRVPLSRATHRTADSISVKSLRPASRTFADDDDRSVRSSAVGASVVSPAGSELDQGTSSQPVRAVGLNPDFVHPLGIESNVASLVDASMLEGSALTTDSEVAGNQRRESMATVEEENREYGGEREQTPVSESQRSRGFVEYELDEYGRKVPQTTYRQSPTEAAITSAAVGAAADFLRRQNGQEKQKQVTQEDDGSFQGAGVQRNRSFKERTKNGHRPGLDSNSTEQLANQHSNPKLGFSSMPDPHDPLPEIGDWHEDDVLTNPSLLDGHAGREDDEQWAEEATPRQNPQHLDDDFHLEPLSLPGTAAAAAAAAAVGAAQNHSRQVSQEHDEWYRTPEDKKRDTLVTNPYEGTSPIANLPGLNDSLLGGNNFDYGHDDYGTRSPRVDEGYISQGPNKTPDIQTQGKGVNFEIAPLGGPSAAADDPFYNSTRHMSGLSQGMASPLYDASTGTGIERIESKDIIALMQHLMVRDAQRSARDTEILVTLVRSATEMRNNFEDLKKLLADTEDVIITEVKENTEKTVTRAINGPRPYPGSAPRSIHAGSTANTIINDDIKKRSIFRRALKGLGAKSANDLGRIEDMLNQLLTEVDSLKARTAPGPHASAQDQQMYDALQQEGQYEQDHGYEPEGHAGTSTASHASQSGYLSIQSRGTSVKPAYDRKVSAHRISTVPEDNEEDHGDIPDNASINYDHPEVLMTPAHVRGDSVPLATPPQAIQHAQGSLSNENTPRTEESKKKGRSSWFRIPKISRWSETTASSAPESNRLSKQSQKVDDGGFPTGPSRSGSLDHYSDNYELAPPQPIHSDTLHTGFSEQDLPGTLHQEGNDQGMYGQMPQSGPPNWVTMTPEDPKYKAHRDSLNLQHPQPRQGQTERFKAALESQALGFDSPMSPRSADWAGSATSLHRLPAHQHRDNYGTPLDPSIYQQHWTSSPAAGNVTATSGGPPRPPKEPLDQSQQQYPTSGAASPVPQNKRLSKLQKPALPHQSVESGYGTMTHGAPTASYISQAGTSISPGPGHQQLENRNLSGALMGGNNGAVNRRPSGPRPMTPTGTGSGRNSGSLAGVGSPLSDDGSVDAARRKRDTFGSLASQDTDTF